MILLNIVATCLSIVASVATIFVLFKKRKKKA